MSADRLRGWGQRSVGLLETYLGLEAQLPLSLIREAGSGDAGRLSKIARS